MMKRIAYKLGHQVCGPWTLINSRFLTVSHFNIITHPVSVWKTEKNISVAEENELSELFDDQSDCLELINDYAQRLNRAMSESNVNEFKAKRTKRLQNQSKLSDNSVSDGDSDDESNSDVSPGIVLGHQSAHDYNFENEIKKRQTIDFILPVEAIRKSFARENHMNMSKNHSVCHYQTDKRIQFEKPESDAPDLAVDIETVNGMVSIESTIYPDMFDL